MADDEHFSGPDPGLSTAPSGNAFGYEMSMSNLPHPPKEDPISQPWAGWKKPRSRGVFQPVNERRAIYHMHTPHGRQQFHQEDFGYLSP